MRAQRTKSGSVRAEGGCPFDEIQDLLEPTGRRDMDGSASRSEAGAGASRTGVAPLHGPPWSVKNLEMSVVKERPAFRGAGRRRVPDFQ